MPAPVFKIKTGLKAKAEIPPNEPAATAHRIISEEWMYSRGVPTIRRGSRYVPAGQIVALERPQCHAVFDCCLQGRLDLVAEWLRSGEVAVDGRNPRVR